MMLNSKQKRSAGAIRLTTLMPLLAVILVVYVFYGYGPFSSRAGETAAIFSAVLSMPNPGINVITERFKDSLYPPSAQTDAQDNPVPINPPQIIGDNTHDTAGEEEAEQNTEPQSSAPNTARMPRIPDEYAAPVISENFAGSSGTALISYGKGFIKNETKVSDDKVYEILDTPFSIDFEDTSEPQVLIMHTHATESYERFDRDIYDTRNTWRSTDNSNNMVTVGDAMQEVLESNGIGVIHDTTQHDYPSYNGSYERSAETITAYLEEYPSIKVVLDLHRDAMQRDDAIIKPVAMINGKKAAQIMIISACDDGTMDIPEWRENLRFAAAFQDYMEQAYPDLTKPVYFCYRKYNMDLTTGSLLLEFGSNANTLEEAIYSARMAGQALSELILDVVYDTP